MLSSTRSRFPFLVAGIARPSIRPLSTSVHLCKQGPGTGENFIQANDPSPPKDTPNVSKRMNSRLTLWARRIKAFESWNLMRRNRGRCKLPIGLAYGRGVRCQKELAMTGPRFEQTIIEKQPQPYAAIELIHKQPVRWVHSKVVACDGGGGPLGHPKIFINTDKPQISQCTYCGLPYANEHHRKHLESLPSTPYPLKPSGDPDEVQMPATPSQFGEVQGTRPNLVGEIQAEAMDGQPFAQR